MEKYKAIRQLMADGEFSKAQDHLVRILQKNPDDWDSKLLYGTCRMMQWDATDDFGGFDLNFLALQEKDTFFPAARKVSFVLESDGNNELKRLILTRDYLSKLLWARTKINAYKMNPTGKNLFDTVIYLEKNGFELLAYTLEESELARKANDKKFQADFKSAAAQQ